jgi:enterochelin esterase family protein
MLAAGQSIAAFTVASERPNQFRKVLSNWQLHQYPRWPYAERVLASEKPIRVFLCDDATIIAVFAMASMTKWDWFVQNVR